MITGLGESSIFYGVVEDINDPLKLGRMRVRIMGLHTELKVGNDDTGEGIPTEDLPWAYPMQPITSAAISGIGDSPTGILNGTHVIGFSRDGRFMNDLVILGTIGGIPQEAPNDDIGFNDPNGKYPKADHIKEPDTNRLARNENIDKTIVKIKKDNIDKDVATANGDSWDEPETPYNAKYPFNHVSESESGHIIEVDDTEGHERLHTYHRTGTFTEVHPDGSRVTKIIGDDYEITQKDKNIHIKGIMNITVEGNANLLIKGNVTEEIKGNINRVVDGNVTEEIKGTVNRIVTGEVTETFKSSKTLSVSGTDTSKAASYSVDGAIDQKGGIVSNEDIVADGISMKNHKHKTIAIGQPTTAPIK